MKQGGTADSVYHSSLAENRILCQGLFAFAASHFVARFRGAKEEQQEEKDHEDQPISG